MQRRPQLSFIAGLVACLVVATPVLAQRAMTLVDLVSVPDLADPQLSPDGRQVVYTLAEADWKANRAISHIWRVNVDGSGTVRMTGGTEGESNPRWSPDGSRIAFLAKRGEAEAAQIFLISNEGGEAVALTTHPTAVSRIAWSPDGSAIYFVAPDAKSDDEKAREKLKDDVYAYDENFEQEHLWAVTVADGNARRITEGDYSVLDYRISIDGQRIAHHRAPSPMYGEREQGEVWLMNRDGSAAVQLTKNRVPEDGAALSPDGAWVMFGAQANQRFETYYNRKIFVVPSTGGEARVLTADLPYEVTGVAWAKDGASIYVLANMGVHSQLLEIPVKAGPARQLTDGQHTLEGWTFDARTNRHVFQLNQPDNPGDVWTLATTAGATPQRVTRVFESLARDFRLPRQERIEWKGADGARVEGLLFYPIDYQAGRKYALVVQTHGGPQASDKFGFGSPADALPVLTAKGYFVLQPNYRGSTGYGDAFLRDMVGSYFKNSHLDVMAGVDHLIKAGMVDPDRMVKMGWSGGGHMTNKIITFTNRFKAASSGAGASNWISMYAQSDVRTYRTPWFGGTPWQENAPIDLYWEHSPLKYAANVTTPTLFLVGDNDVRVPPPQSVEMWRALKSRGIPTHLYRAPREPHGWQELRHRLFKVNVELAWFEKYANGREYTWEKAPGDAKP
jgi:dipeptidyl aminopeptidase/acylaminoacyl peptidase